MGIINEISIYEIVSKIMSLFEWNLKGSDDCV
jgi:hypothetical protein